MGRLDLDRLHLAAVGIVAPLAIGTAVMVALPNVAGHFDDPALDLVLDTLAAVVTGSIAALLGVRYRERRETIALYEAAAFLTLAISYAIAVVVAVSDDSGGAPSARLVETGEAQLYVFTAARWLAAGMLVSGATASLHAGGRRRPGASALAAVIIVFALGAVAETWADTLPALFRSTVSGLGPQAQPDATTTPIGFVVQIVGAALTMAAAAVYHSLWHRDRARRDGYVALGLVLASFAQLHAALFPSIHPVQVASSDLLWLAFEMTLLLAIEAEEKATLRALRTANQALELLRDAEVDRAALEERTRLSRELHDGLAQDLWFAKLKVGRLSALANVGTEAIELCHELEGAVDSALAEAREAVMALRLGGGESGASLSDLMRRHVDDFADRFGIRAEFECDPQLPRLTHRAEAELLRITQEALSNVRRHADATLVQVRLEAGDARLLLTVRDNGRGFDPATVDDGRFGLAGMRERAGLIRGRLTIDSRPRDGTRVTVEVPVGPDGAIAEVAR